MKNAFRLGYNRYFDDKQFEENLAFVKENIDVIDELTLFVEYSHHGYWELSQQKEVARVLKDRMEKYRAAGVKSVGINVLATIGHLDESYDVLPKPPFQTMVGDDGQVSKSCLCINNAEYLAYIEERYKILAESAPDFIWIDDDFRIVWHGVTNPCFCSKCLADFSASAGKNFNRESLVKAIASDKKVSDAFDCFRRDKFTDLAERIEKSVHGVNENINIGFMTSPNWTETVWLEKFKAKMARPGGGFYHDEKPTDVLRKIFEVGKQNMLLPANIRDIQYEFENFPYQEFAKSQTMIRLECMLALMSGCNGVLYNAMLSYDYPRLTDTVRSRVKQWDKICEYAENGKNIGIFGNQQACLNFGELGIPLAFSEDGASTIVLCGESDVNKLSDEKLLSYLKGGLFLDGDAFAAVEKRGLARYCGIVTKKTFTNGMTERHTSHPLNGQTAGYVRDIFTSFWFGEKAVSVYETRGAEELSRLENIKHEDMGCCAAVYENELGGRVCVMGYCFPEFFKTREKQKQLQNVFDYLGKTLPAVCYGNQRFAVTCRDAGHRLISVTNVSIDEADNFTLEVRGSYKNFFAIDEKGLLQKMEIIRAENCVKLKPKTLKAWDYCIILCEK